MIHHVIEVHPLDGQKLWLKFDTDETKIFDVTPYLGRGRFALLKDQTIFQQARIAYGTVEWPQDLDLDPEDLYRYSTAE